MTSGENTEGQNGMVPDHAGSESLAPVDGEISGARKEALAARTIKKQDNITHVTVTWLGGHDANDAA